MDSGAVREASIHFELYRLIKNCLCSGRFRNYCILDVEPELSVGGRSADLVLMDKEKESCILVIEVKGRGKGDYAVYDEAAEKQASNYANHLDACFYAVTNGIILRLFRRPNMPIGDYNFELSETCVGRFLEGLLSLYFDEKMNLDLPHARTPEERKKGRDVLVEAIIKALKEIDNKSDFRLETRILRKTNMYYLSVGEFKQVFRLGIPLKNSREANPFLTIMLDELRKKFAEKDLKKLLERLSQISGFEWIKEANLRKQFTWRYLTPYKEIDAEKVKMDLKAWFKLLQTQ